MSDADALLWAILSDPADDLPRLMYADWLEEHPVDPCPHCGGGRPGEWCHPVNGAGRCATCDGTNVVPNRNAERAEFIRVQVELASRAWNCPGCSPHSTHCFEGCDDCDTHSALRRRERELWAKGVKGAFVGVPGGWIVAITGETPGGWDRLAEFRRGFVEAISCDLAAFAGGPCEVCRYWSRGPGTYMDPGHPSCGTCRGTGRTPGIAKALFLSQPVTAVTLTDREPYWNGGGFCWYRTTRHRPSPAVPESAVLPDEFLKPRLASFVSIGDATDWLSRRAVAWGRGLAGLLPLPATALQPPG